MSKQIYLKDSREKLLEGVNLLADAVQSTLGPSGKTVIIKNEDEEVFVTKDGVTVANSMNSDDPVIDAAIQLVKKVSGKMDIDCKDGTTTVTVLCRMLIALGMQYQKQPDYNEHLFKKVVYEMLEEVLTLLDEKGTPLALSDVHKIAYTSANNDHEIAALFQEAFDNAGREGYINIVESINGKSYVDIIKGFVVDLGYAERRYANNPLSGYFEAKKANVIIINNELSSKKDILAIVKKANGFNNPLPVLIIAKDFSKDVMGIIDYNNLDRTGVDFCLIKNHLRNDEYHMLLEDISKFTGAEIASEFDQFDYTFGTAVDLVVKQGFTIFGIPEGAALELLDEHISVLDEASKVEKSAFIKDLYRKRISKMTKGITTIYVGANSDVELKEKKHRVDDAYGSCKSALESNIIMGGGQSLAIISKYLLSSRKPTTDQLVFINVIQEPFKQILRNSYHTQEEMKKIYENIYIERGYNAKTRQYEDLIETGIVDPLKVVKEGLKNAVSVAMTVLSTECLIVEKPKTN